MSLPLRVGFAGTPAFAAVALAALHDSGVTIPLVLTRPDRPKGRGLKLEPSPVKALADRLGLPVLTPASLRTPDARAPLVAIDLDVLVVAAYGLILPQEVLNWPRCGCLNIHASRLPRWRGAAPIQRAILAGDASTGVSIMQMDAGLDTGPVIGTVDVAIAPTETAGTLHDRLADAGAGAIVEAIGRLARDGRLPFAPQPAEGVTYAHKIDRREAAIDWTRAAAEIDRQVRAFDPTPGAYAELEGERIKLWRARPAESGAAADPGTTVEVGSAGITVACGEGGRERIVLAELQPAGAKRMPVAAFVAGRRLKPGARWTTPTDPAPSVRT